MLGKILLLLFLSISALAYGDCNGFHKDDLIQSGKTILTLRCC